MIYVLTVFGFAEKTIFELELENRGELPLLYITRYKVSKTNAEKHLTMIRKIAEWVKRHRRLTYFIHSTYCILKTEDPSVETWMNIDEYKNQESYDKFAKEFKKSNPDWTEFFKIEEEMKALLVPNSVTHEVFIENPELRIA
jgi:hypothetical protein